MYNVDSVSKSFMYFDTYNGKLRFNINQKSGALILTR